MPFIGNTPAAVPLTSADIADGIITSAKIVDGTIVNADINATSAITLNKLSGNPIFRNRIINGDMSINQRNATINNGAATNTYVVDRFCMFGAAASKMSGQQSTTAPTYFKNSFLITSLAATTASASDPYGFRQVIEGSNIVDLSWGSASAKTVTISFWVRSSITGTYALALFNRDAPDRSYVETYTINAANTFEYKTITIQGDTSGTWLTTNGQGIQVWWDLGSGSNFNTTAGSWVSALDVRTSGSSNWIGTSGATFYITGVQLEVGTSATDFELLPIDVNEFRCLRYFEIFYLQDYSVVGQAYSTSAVLAPVKFAVQKRSTPTATLPTVGITSGTIIFTNSAGTNPSTTTGSITASELNVSKLSLYGSGFTSSYTAGNVSLLYSSGGTQIKIDSEL